MSGSSGFHRSMFDLSEPHVVQLRPHERDLLEVAARLEHRGHPYSPEERGHLERAAQIVGRAQPTHTPPSGEHSAPAEVYPLRPRLDPSPAGVYPLRPRLDPSPEPSWLAVPNDPGAALEYLDALERARLIELAALRDLRTSITRGLPSADHPHVTSTRSFLPVKHRAAAIAGAVLLALVLAGGAIALTTSRESAGQQRAAAAGVSGDGTAGVAEGHDHAAMGSGLGVELGEFFVRPSRATVPAGTSTLVLRNTGTTEHEFMIIPVRAIRGSVASMSSEQVHQAAVHSVHGIEPGARTESKVKLTPGKYLLFCNLPGHLAGGQSVRLTVT